MPIERNFFTPSEAASMLGITRSQIYRAIHDDTLKAEKLSPRLVAIAPEEVERYRREHLGKRGWNARRQPIHEPSKNALYMRDYRARKRAERDRGQPSAEGEL